MSLGNGHCFSFIFFLLTLYIQKTSQETQKKFIEFSYIDS